ncbi:MAG: hypothetical protein KF773_24880 [Deltaproteobacteria bacterium]|nr:hypothetical protein [Deltaproteobacteria bacterium]
MRRAALVLALVAVAACATSHDTPERRRFAQRVHAALHPSSPPLAEARLVELLALDDDEIIARLYAEPATREAVLRVGLAFLGAPVDQLQIDGGWAEAPFAFAPAIAAANAFATGTDPLPHLFTTRAPTPTGPSVPVRRDTLALFLPGLELTGDRAAQREVVERLILNDLASLRAQAQLMPEPFDAQQLCGAYAVGPSNFLRGSLAMILGAPFAIAGAGYPMEFDDPTFAPLDAVCRSPSPPARTREEMLAQLDRSRLVWETFLVRLEHLFAVWEGDGAFAPLDLPAAGFVPYVVTPPPLVEPQFYPRFWQLALNSSTNYDRRRGAYVLARFFCDDLKLVGAALPEVHGAGRHASEPACAACHFKLDPMAGFFRRHGQGGVEYTDDVLAANLGEIVFDDGATMPYAAYEQAWRAAPGSGRDFDVGYIRSTRDASLNSYGSTLPDLDAILGAAPDVERCFARRLFEHFNGPDQAVDPGFLDDVAADMRASGADRLRRGVTRILAGNTFREPRRNSNTCYDLAPDAAGGGATDRPPCEVASTLRTSCTSCHGGDDPQAGLDLTVWEPARDGELGFRHVVGGAPVARLDTLARILDRLVTSDPTRQMPQGGDMPLRAREDLALWVRAQLER